MAQKLGVDQGKVQTAVDEIRAEHKSARQDKIKQNLDQAVKDGKITQDQENKILDKLSQLQSQRQANAQSFKNMTPQQRRDALKQQRQDLQNWANQNGIDVKYLFGAHARGFGKREMWVK